MKSFKTFITELKKGKYRSDMANPSRIRIARAATKADVALDQKYGYGTIKGGVSPIPGINREKGFGASANYNSAEAALRSINRGETDRAAGEAVHRGWGKTVSQIKAPNPKKQADRERLKSHAFSELPKDEQQKDLDIVTAVRNKLKAKVNRPIREEKDRIGKKTHSAEEIAKKHGLSVDYIEKQIEKGKKVEMEHTNNEEEAEEIARDHLWEFPDYYDRLDKMEKQAKKKWEK